MSAAESGPVVVEQLNRVQWHAIHSNGHWGGVNDWCTVVADALADATLNGLAVETVSLEGERHVLMHAAKPLGVRR